VLARFVIPVANGTPHTLVEDGHGHVYFALKVRVDACMSGCV
jgi:hypothetical protein